MDYPRKFEGNRSLLWKEFILAKVLLVLGSLISLVTIILLLVAMFQYDWQRFSAQPDANRTFDLEVGLLKYRVRETNLANVVEPIQIVGTFKYSTYHNATDKIAKDTYEKAGKTTFGLFWIPLAFLTLSLLFSLFSIIGFGPKRLVAAFAYTGWSLALLSGILIVIFCIVWAGMKSAKNGVSIPADADATMWVDGAKAKLAVGDSWGLAFGVGMVSAFVQSLIIFVPLCVIGCMKLRERDSF